MFNRVGNAPRGQPVRNARGGARRLNMPDEPLASEAISGTPVGSAGTTNGILRTISGWISPVLDRAFVFHGNR